MTSSTGSIQVHLFPGAQPEAEACGGGAVVYLAFHPVNVAVHVTSRAQGDGLVAAFTAARDMCPGPPVSPVIAPECASGGHSGCWDDDQYHPCECCLSGHTLSGQVCTRCGQPAPGPADSSGVYHHAAPGQDADHAVELGWLGNHREHAQVTP